MRIQLNLQLLGLEIKISNKEAIQPKETQLLESTLEALSHFKFLLKEDLKQKLVKMIENIALLSEYQGYQKYIEIFNFKVSEPSQNIKEILKTLNIDELVYAIEDTLEIKEINIEKSYFILKNKFTNKEITIFGCEAYPSDSIEIVTKYFEDNAGKINYLLLEESPIVIEPVIDSMKLKFFEKMEYVRKNSKVFYELDKEILQDYVSSFIKENDAFALDIDKDIIFLNYGKKVKFPSEIATVAYKFNKYSDKSKHPKVILISFINK